MQSGRGCKLLIGWRAPRSLGAGLSSGGAGASGGHLNLNPESGALPLARCTLFPEVPGPAVLFCCFFKNVQKRVTRFSLSLHFQVKRNPVPGPSPSTAGWRPPGQALRELGARGSQWFPRPRARAGTGGLRLARPLRARASVHTSWLPEHPSLRPSRASH